MQIEDGHASLSLKILGLEKVNPYKYRTADLFAGGYSTDGEAHNRTVAEALSSETMAIVTKIKGHRYAFGDVPSAIFVEPDDQESSVKAMMNILDLSEEDRKKLGKQGREHIVRNFDWDVVIDGLVRNIYQEVVKEKRDKPASSGTIYTR